MYMALVVQQYVVWFNVSVYDSLLMDISQRTTELCNPKSNRLFRERLPGDVEAEVTARHEIDNNVSRVPVSNYQDTNILLI